MFDNSLHASQHGQQFKSKEGLLSYSNEDKLRSGDVLIGAIRSAPQGEEEVCPGASTKNVTNDLLNPNAQ